MKISVLPLPLAIVMPALAVLILLPAACSDGEALDSPVILRVNGIPITLAEFEKEFYYERTFRKIVEEGEEKGPDKLTTGELRARIINESLVPFAVVRSAFKERIPELLKKARAIRAEIKEDRSNFGSLSAEHSAPSTARSRGRLGYFSRSGGLPYPVPQVAFSVPPEGLSEPFLSIIGCHILYVTRIVKGTTDSLDRVEAYHIFLPYVEDEAFLQNGLPRLVEEASIEVVDPAFAECVAGTGSAGEADAAEEAGGSDKGNP
jgi:hypothetical protein